MILIIGYKAKLPVSISQILISELSPADAMYLLLVEIEIQFIVDSWAK